MLTAEGCRSRRARLWDALEEKPDCIVLSSPRHLVYYANYYASPFVFRSQNSLALLLLFPDNRSTLVVDNLTRAFADSYCVDHVLEAPWYDGRNDAYARDGGLVSCAIGIVNEENFRRIGFEAGTPGGLLAGFRERWPDAEWIDIGSEALEAQTKKDADELPPMRESIRAGEAGFSAAINRIRPGMTEFQAYEVVANAAMEALGKQVLVYGDFASGPRTELGGGPPTNRVIEKDDLFILDFSVIVHGYRADFANTFVVDGGRADPRLKDLEHVCLEAMASAEKTLGPGIACRKVDMVARASLASHDKSYELGHHVGHGLGLGHPDPPYIVPNSLSWLSAGNIVTIEPGQYHAGLGGMRFERNYLITTEGFETLTHHFLGLEPHA